MSFLCRLKRRYTREVVRDGRHGDSTEPRLLLAVVDYVGAACAIALLVLYVLNGGNL